ncbi:hypothetical protein BJV78DRAFT_1175035 [Lactifluus subvellereus]|nr:hypothetical protein BJV78DRAFT_1175035 [Lactifluus subvellereus]
MSKRTEQTSGHGAASGDAEHGQGRTGQSGRRYCLIRHLLWGGPSLGTCHRRCCHLARTSSTFCKRPQRHS